MKAVNNAYDVVDFVSTLASESRVKGEAGLATDLAFEVSRAATASDLLRAYLLVLKNWKNKSALYSKWKEQWESALNICTESLHLGDPRFRTSAP